MNHEIREATANDAPELFPLAEAMATSFQVEQKAFFESLDEIIVDSAAKCLVAEADGKIVGYLLGFDHRAFFANGRVSWVEEIYITDSLRRFGLGRDLMNHFENWCRSRGSRLIGLATRRASDFYKALSYEESATYFRRVLNVAAQPDGGVNECSAGAPHS